MVVEEEAEAEEESKRKRKEKFLNKTQFLFYFLQFHLLLKQQDKFFFLHKQNFV